MAKLSELAENLEKRFKGVPNASIEDANNWAERSMLEHGYMADDDVPDNQKLLVLLYAEWDGALQLSLQTAYYFEYTDGEETIDKAKISEQYRKVAVELRKKYENKSVESGPSSNTRFTIMTRADRN